jgi:TPR repeat protein
MAVAWYRKAARKKDAKALYNLGLCYKHGHGVRRSARWARHYFELAGKLGHKEAARELNKG